MFTRTRLAALAFAVLLIAIPAAAQGFTPADLPSDTSFAVYFHGGSSLKTGYADSPAAKFWFSRDTSQLRLQLVEYMLRQSKRPDNTYQIKPTAENADRILSLLENPVIFGMSSPADVMSMAQSPSDASARIMNASGMFFIADVHGKDEQFEKLWREIMASLNPKIARATLELAGVKVERFTGPVNMTFTARTGNYFVVANKRSVIEELLQRLRPGSTPSGSLRQDSDFSRCQTNSGPGTLLEAFFRVPDLSKIPLPSTPVGDLSGLVNGLHIDALHSACGSMSVTSDGSRMRGDILVDTSAGGIFSLFGENKPDFKTLALAPSSATSFTVMSFNLPAFYKVLRSAIAASLPQNQQSGVSMLEMMGAGFLGMPIPDALGLFGGELASVQLEPPGPATQSMFALSITDSQQILALIHKLGASRIAEEKQESGITLFTLVKPPVDPAASSPPSPPYFLGVGPNIMLVSQNPRYIRDAAARFGSGGGDSIANNPVVAGMRAALPHDLLSFFVTDFKRYDWAALMKGLFDAPDSKGTSARSPEDAQFFENLRKFPWGSLSATLHWSVGAWWKDADGFHFQTNYK